MLKKLLNLLGPIFGFLFISAYIRNACVNVIYTDYTRLVTVYLNDVFSFKPYLHLDIFTRMPINYIQRIINVYFFKYSTIFDMLLGALFLSLIFFILGKYIIKKNLSINTYFVVAILTFSLNKWEMLTNGTGWIHFFAIALFIYHFYILDDDKNKKYECQNLYLPVFTILFVAGPYSISYTLVILLIYFYNITKDGFIKKNILKYLNKIICILIPFILYIFSKINSVEEYAGTVNMGLEEAIKTKFLILIKLFIKSFASNIFTEEYFKTYNISEAIIILISLIVIFSYIFAIYINIKYKIYEDTLFPMILILYSIFNHILVSGARWIFLNDTYAMSSRYSLQYFFGMIGIVLSFAYNKKYKKIKNNIYIFIVLFFVVGNILSTKRELDIAKYRKENFEKIREIGLDFENVEDSTLKKVFQYHDGKRTRKALTILKSKKLNIFR